MFDAVLLDLDDTLHPEGSFVESGHRAVASAIAQATGEPCATVFEALRYDYFKYGRSGLFDRAAQRYGLPGRQVKELVEVYRGHQPDIQPDSAVIELLRRMRGRYRLAIVTDGDVNVQAAKIAALGLADLVDAVVYCWALSAPKPDPAGYREALRQLNCAPSAAVIVGDDPLHDVAAAAAMDVACVRIRAHRYKELTTRSPPVRYTEVESVLAIEEAIERLAKTAARPQS